MGHLKRMWTGASDVNMLNVFSGTGFTGGLF